MEKTEAWLVPVWTTRVEGTRPTLVVYAAGFREASEAVQAVKQHMDVLPTDDVKDASPMKPETAKALNLLPGSIWML